MMKQIVALCAVLALTAGAKVDTKPKDLLCDVCMDVVQDIDEWITSDSTIDEVIHFAEGLCHQLAIIGPELEELCIQLVDEKIPDIINGLVNDNLSPEQVCADVVGWCYKPPPSQH